MLTAREKKWISQDIDEWWCKVVESVNGGCYTGCDGREVMDYIFSIVRDTLNRAAEAKAKSNIEPAPEWRMIRV